MDNYEYNMATRKSYADNQYDQCKVFDNSMFIISSGIFGVSFSFLQNIIKNPQKDVGWILILSWSLILSSIIISLLAYLINYYAYKKAIEIIDIRIRNETAVAIEKEPKNRKQHIAEIMNIVNLIFLICGMISLMIYIGINFIGG